MLTTTTRLLGLLFVSSPFVLLAAFHVYRLFLYRRAPSAVIAVNWLAGPGWLAYMMGYIPRDFTNTIVALIFLAGVCAVHVTMNYEVQQPRPFR